MSIIGLESPFPCLFWVVLVAATTTWHSTSADISSGSCALQIAPQSSASGALYLRDCTLDTPLVVPITVGYLQLSKVHVLTAVQFVPQVGSSSVTNFTLRLDGGTVVAATVELKNCTVLSNLTILMIDVVVRVPAIRVFTASADLLSLVVRNVTTTAPTLIDVVAINASKHANVGAELAPTITSFVVRAVHLRHRYTFSAAYHQDLGLHVSCGSIWCSHDFAVIQDADVLIEASEFHHELRYTAPNELPGGVNVLQSTLVDLRAISLVANTVVNVRDTIATVSIFATVAKHFAVQTFTVAAEAAHNVSFTLHNVSISVKVLDSITGARGTTSVVQLEKTTASMDGSGIMRFHAHQCVFDLESVSRVTVVHLDPISGQRDPSSLREYLPHQQLVVVNNNATTIGKPVVALCIVIDIQSSIATLRSTGNCAPLDFNLLGEMTNGEFSQVTTSCVARVAMVINLATINPAADVVQCRVRNSRVSATMSLDYEYDAQQYVNGIAMSIVGVVSVGNAGVVDVELVNTPVHLAVVALRFHAFVSHAATAIAVSIQAGAVATLAVCVRNITFSADCRLGVTTHLTSGQLTTRTFLGGDGNVAVTLYLVAISSSVSEAANISVEHINMVVNTTGLDLGVAYSKGTAGTWIGCVGISPASAIIEARGLTSTVSQFLVQFLSANTPALTWSRRKDDLDSADEGTARFFALWRPNATKHTAAVAVSRVTWFLATSPQILQVYVSHQTAPSGGSTFDRMSQLAFSAALGVYGTVFDASLLHRWVLDNCTLSVWHTVETSPVSRCVASALLNPTDEQQAWVQWSLAGVGIIKSSVSSLYLTVSSWTLDSAPTSYSIVVLRMATVANSTFLFQRVSLLRVGASCGGLQRISNADATAPARKRRSAPLLVAATTSGGGLLSNVTWTVETCRFTIPLHPRNVGVDPKGLLWVVMVPPPRMSTSTSTSELLFRTRISLFPGDAYIWDHTSRIVLADRCSLWNGASLDNVSVNAPWHVIGNVLPSSLWNELPPACPVYSDDDEDDTGSTEATAQSDAATERVAMSAITAGSIAGVLASIVGSGTGASDMQSMSSVLGSSCIDSRGSSSSTASAYALSPFSGLGSLYAIVLGNVLLVVLVVVAQLAAVVWCSRSGDASGSKRISFLASARNVLFGPVAVAASRRSSVPARLAAYVEQLVHLRASGSVRFPNHSLNCALFLTPGILNASVKLLFAPEYFFSDGSQSLTPHAVVGQVACGLFGIAWSVLALFWMNQFFIVKLGLAIQFKSLVYTDSSHCPQCVLPLGQWKPDGLRFRFGKLLGDSNHRSKRRWYWLHLAPLFIQVVGALPVTSPAACAVVFTGMGMSLAATAGYLWMRTPTRTKASSYLRLAAIVVMISIILIALLRKAADVRESDATRALLLLSIANTAISITRSAHCVFLSIVESKTLCGKRMLLHPKSGGQTAKATPSQNPSFAGSISSGDGSLPRGSMRLLTSNERLAAQQSFTSVASFVSSLSSMVPSSPRTEHVRCLQQLRELCDASHRSKSLWREVDITNRLQKLLELAAESNRLLFFDNGDTNGSGSLDRLL